MKCPACNKTLREKGAGGMTLDMCYGGCGGIWFDATELEKVNDRTAATLHTIWQIPSRVKPPGEPRACPRCVEQVLDRKWFSDAQSVEIDQCAKCGGIWLDDGEFSSIYAEIKKDKTGSPAWAVAMADAVTFVKRDSGANRQPPHA